MRQGWTLDAGFAYCFGWRVEELLGLKCGQVDLIERTIRLNPGETKNGAGRTVNMTATVYELLSSLVRDRGQDEYVFLRDDGKPVVDFRGTWAAVCEQAGVPDLLFHDLRRTAVRNMVRAGIPERVAMMISGHKTRSVFDRYNIVSPTDLRESARKMDAYQQKQKQFDYSLTTVKPISAMVAKGDAIN